MTIMQEVRRQVEAQAPGTLFSFQEFAGSSTHTQNVAKALSLLNNKGIVRRLAKGLYYKPAFGVLGEKPPSYEQIITKLLALNKKNISYLSGTNIYRQLGLTTQVAKEFVIASDEPRSPVKIGTTEVRFIQSHVTVAVEDFRLLQLLDAVWEIKKIPDSTPMRSAKILQARFKELTSTQRKLLAVYAQDYPPSTRALVGLLLSSIGATKPARELKASLNPLTHFELALDPQLFPSARDWNFV